jgi:uncharacterized lipoprotein YddW (UPF0748 family)
MKGIMKSGIVSVALVFLFAATASAQPTLPATSPTDAPPAPREFRGAWVASVNNSTWPPRPGMTEAEQKSEAIRQLDRVVELKLNAVVFQVRPAADALYRSRLEPWSEYLSGVQGRNPGYDPLEFWIDEAHKRGLELHAWFNPYRAKHKDSKSAISPDHIARRQPSAVRKYGNYLWLDPGDPAAARHSLAVFLDVVKRYDVDGIHMDDYFYPYQERDPKGQVIPFPDESSWQRYKRTGGKLERNDWRRHNVNEFMRVLYGETKKIKPHVKVGIAPFGIWKPEHPPGIKGLNQYEVLYADAKLWLNEGWLDYFSPQLYWKIEGPQSFTKLLDWWVSENTQKRHIWPGQSVGRYIPKDGSLSMEVPNQLAAIRKSPGSDGFIFWPLQAVMRESALTKRLKAEEFAEQALVPPSPWLDDQPPAAPQAGVAREANGAVMITFQAADEPVWQHAIYARYGDTWKFRVVPGSERRVNLPPGDINAIVISAVDRTANESDRVTLSLAGAPATHSRSAP